MDAKAGSEQMSEHRFQHGDHVRIVRGAGARLRTSSAATSLTCTVYRVIRLLRLDSNEVATLNTLVGRGKSWTDWWAPRGLMAVHNEDDAAGQYVDRRSRHSFDLNWRDCCSAQVWRACRSAEKNYRPLFVWPKFPGLGHMGQEIRNELNRQSSWPLDIQEIPSSRLGMGTRPLRPNLLNISGRSMLNDRPI